MPPKVTKLQEGGQGQKRVTKTDPPESEIATNNKKVGLEKEAKEVQEKSDPSEKGTDAASEEKSEKSQAEADDVEEDEYADIRQKPDEIADDDKISDDGAGEVNMVHRRDDTMDSTPGAMSSKTSMMRIYACAVMRT